MPAAGWLVGGFVAFGFAALAVWLIERPVRGVGYRVAILLVGMVAVVATAGALALPLRPFFAIWLVLVIVILLVRRWPLV